MPFGAERINMELTTIELLQYGRFISASNFFHSCQPLPGGRGLFNGIGVASNPKSSPMEMGIYQIQVGALQQGGCKVCIYTHEQGELVESFILKVTGKHKRLLQ
jgi:hypothetical protein